MTKKTNKKTYKKSVPASVKKYVAKAIDNSIEDKQYTESLSTNFGSISSGWNEVAVTQLTQGDGMGQRVGNRIKVKSLEIKGVIASGSENSVADDPYNVVRCIIATWNDKQTSPCATSALGIDSAINNITNGKGYLRRKYYDKFIPLSVASSCGTDNDKFVPNLKGFHYYKRFKKPLFIQFTSDTNDYPNQTLAISMVSDSGVVLNPGFVNGYISMRYEDA